MSPISMLMRSTPSVTRVLRELVRKLCISEEVLVARVESQDSLNFYGSDNLEKRSVLKARTLTKTS
jgi:hypothetical protein